jgi:hypothetical protein
MRGGFSFSALNLTFQFEFATKQERNKDFRCGSIFVASYYWQNTTKAFRCSSIFVARNF